jgi:hypothetical protein
MDNLKQRIQRRVRIQSDHLPMLTAHAARRPAFGININPLHDKPDANGMVLVNIAQYNIGTNQAFSNLVHFFIDLAESQSKNQQQ